MSCCLNEVMGQTGQALTMHLYACLRTEVRIVFSLLSFFLFSSSEHVAQNFVFGVWFKIFLSCFVLLPQKLWKQFVTLAACAESFFGHPDVSVFIYINVSCTGPRKGALRTATTIFFFDQSKRKKTTYRKTRIKFHFLYDTLAKVLSLH